MNWKRKTIGTAAVMLFIIFGFLGCSGRKAASADETSGDSSEQFTENAEADSAVGLESAEPGFVTPEDAVLDYLAGMRDNDFDRMALSFGGGRCAESIACQYAYLCGIDLIPGIEIDNTVLLKESGDAERLLEQIAQRMEETDFSSMEFLGFVLPDDLSDTYSTDTYQENLSVLAENYGVNELANRVAAVKVNGNEYMLFFDLIKKNDRWYNLQMGGIFASILGIESSATGCVRMDEEDKKILEELLEDTEHELPGTKEKIYLQRTEAEGFDTPWQAAVAYLEGMQANDIGQMLTTFSVESYAENYNLQAYMEYLEAYSFMHQDVKFPSVNDFVKALISGERKEQLADDILSQEGALYACSFFLNGEEMQEDDFSLKWETLQGKMDLASIEIIGYILPETLSEQYTSEYQSNIVERQTGIYGADQILESVIIFEYKGEKYCLFMEESKYNGKWYNSKIGNRLALLLGVDADFKGAPPLGLLGDPADLEELITYI